MFTNINIVKDDSQYNYIVEYERGIKKTSDKLTYLLNEELKDNKNTLLDNISFWYNGRSFLNHQNYWYIPDGEEKEDYIPITHDQSLIRLYFPQYSPDIYTGGLKYSLTISTWIAGHRIILGSFIFDRMDALACPQEKLFINNKYYECVDFYIPDPFSIIYSDNWKKFRENICGETQYTNDTGSVLYFSLQPIEKYEDIYIKSNKYTGGQNSINLLSGTQGNMKLNLSTNILQSLKSTTQEPVFELDITFNETYKKDLKEYLSETYDIKNPKIKYSLVIGNENDLYAIHSKEIDNVSTHCEFEKSLLVQNNFNNWGGWKPGIQIIGSVDIIDSGNEETVLSLLSNSLPMTMELTKYFIGDGYIDKYNYTINNVELKYVDMNLYNINAVNKIENKIVQMDNINDAKSNIIQPVFFRTFELSNIVIHKEVMETICLNLDVYKSKVSRFILQVEGIKFIEIGRNKYGVLFKIDGKKLPKKESQGNYYILDQDSEMITFGQYSYE